GKNISFQRSGCCIQCSGTQVSAVLIRLHEEARMSQVIAFVKRTVVCLIALVLVYVVPTLANPNNYPQFAQQQGGAAIPIFFTGVERGKAQLDAGHPPVLVDVRSAEEYNA